MTQVKPLTPALLLDEAIMQSNIARMHERLSAHEVIARPHIKTAKSLPVIERMVGAPEARKVPDSGGGARLTVSTLREASEVIAAGYRDVLYAVGIVPRKLQELASLAATSGAHISVLLDSVSMAAAVSACAPNIDAFIELDVDDHRAGVGPESDELLAIGAVLAGAAASAHGQAAANKSVPGARRKSCLRGVMTHAGGAYDCRSSSSLVAMAERERSGAVRAAERLRAAGFECPEVSIGSTPTVSFAKSFAGVTEVRVGVYVFNDLVMAGLGVCRADEIALSVLTTVIGHQPRRNTLLVDAGWMALSSDRSTSDHATDQGLGLVTGLAKDESPRALAPGSASSRAAELVVVGANQEHGLIQRRDGGALDFQSYPIGCELRILPVHACSTAAQFDGYHLLVPESALATDGLVAAGYWPRFGGW